MAGFNLTGCKVVTSITSLFTKNKNIKYKKNIIKGLFLSSHTWQTHHNPCGSKLDGTYQPVTNPSPPVTHT